MRVDKSSKNSSIDENPSKISGILFAIAASLILHGLAAATIYITLPEKKIAPPKVRMIVVDLVSFKSGASSDQKTRIEKKSDPTIQSPQKKKSTIAKPKRVLPRNEIGAKLTQTEPTAQKMDFKVLKKPLPVGTTPKTRSQGQPAKHQIAGKLQTNNLQKMALANARSKETKPLSIKVRSSPNVQAEKLPIADKTQSLKSNATTKSRAKKERTVKRTPIRPKASKSRKSKTIQKARASSNPRRKKKAITKKVKSLSTAGRLGRALKKKGKSKAGRTQGARYIGAGLSNPRPRYPPNARRRNQQGRVMLRVRVSTGGRSDSVRVIRSSGYRSLDKAALAAVHRWRFRPALRSGKAVVSNVVVPITFRLRN